MPELKLNGIRAVPANRLDRKGGSRLWEELAKSLDEKRRVQPRREILHRKDRNDEKVRNCKGTLGLKA